MAEQLLTDALQVVRNFLNFTFTFWGITLSYGDVLVGLFLLSVGIWFFTDVMQ